MGVCWIHTHGLSAVGIRKGGLPLETVRLFMRLFIRPLWGRAWALIQAAGPLALTSGAPARFGVAGWPVPASQSTPVG